MKNRFKRVKRKNKLAIYSNHVFKKILEKNMGSLLNYEAMVELKYKKIFRVLLLICRNYNPS